MKNEAENSRQSTITRERVANSDLLASLLDPPIDFPVRVPSPTLMLNGVTDLLIETAGSVRIIPTDEIAEIEVDRGSNRLIVTRREIPEDPSTLRTSTFLLNKSVREWVYADDVPPLFIPNQSIYNILVPTMGVWKVTSSIAYRGEIVH
jgi:hypothetical protein